MIFCHLRKQWAVDFDFRGGSYGDRRFVGDVTVFANAEWVRRSIALRTAEEGALILTCRRV